MSQIYNDIEKIKRQLADALLCEMLDGAGDVNYSLCQNAQKFVVDIVDDAINDEFVNGLIGMAYQQYMNMVELLDDADANDFDEQIERHRAKYGDD